VPAFPSTRKEILAVCHETTSTPPVSTLPITKADGQRLTLTSTDGAHYSAFLAQPERPSGVGIVVLPDIRGLFRFYEDLALRLAEQGHTSLAIDYFGRTAGLTVRDENFPYRDHIMRVIRPTIDADILAAREYVQWRPAGACHHVFALGFCFGGRQAFFASAARFGFTGVIGFYGALSLYPNGADGPLQHAAQLRAPILGLFGGADGGIPRSDIAAFDEALKSAGVGHEFVTYPGAPHSFFDVKFHEHTAACDDAWKRVLDFVARHSDMGDRLPIDRIG
jgi:carboxymethylenebutenolidase